MTLIADVKHMKEAKTPQQIELYITKLQALGRHLQLQDFRTWLNHKCHLPINIRPNNINTREYMDQEQIEEWIDQWTKNNAKGKEQRLLRNFLRQNFAVQPNEKMQKCHGCQQPFMHFLLLPMTRLHNMNKYDLDEHALFCYNCCTEVSQMFESKPLVAEHSSTTDNRKTEGIDPTPTRPIHGRV